jgi:DNA-binding PadR family transcriptional regulator
LAISKQRSTPQAASTHQEIRVAWVMLLLEDKATYGYELRRQLAWHRLKVDPAGVYRTLRQLERDGWVQSRWMRPASGPRRRLYRLTPAGRQNLDELAGVIDDMRDTHDRFLRAYHRALRDRLASAPDSDEPPTE